MHQERPMNKISIAIVLIMLMFTVSCNNDESVDIQDLGWTLSIVDSSGESMNTITAGATVTLRLEIFNDMVEDIGITYDHCTPYVYHIYQGDEIIWSSLEADCIIYESELIGAGNSLVFTEEWTAIQWYPYDQQYYDLVPGTYAFNAKFVASSVIHTDSRLAIDEVIEFYIDE